MSFRQCGVNSLPELIAMLLLVTLISYGIAYFWMVVLEDFYKNGEKPNMSALHVLNLIVGFLYVGLIRESKERWVSTMKTANDLMLTSHSMVLAVDGQEELRLVRSRIQDVRKQLVLFYKHTSMSHWERIFSMFCACSGKQAIMNKVKHCLLIRQKMHTLYLSIPKSNSRLMSLFSRLESITASVENRYFSKEPQCFKWHLRVLLFVYFAILPVQLFNEYSDEVVFVLYPIIIYFLFSVAILANIFGNPIEHPELNECFEALNKEIMNDIRDGSNGTYLRTLKVY